MTTIQLTHSYLMQNSSDLLFIYSGICNQVILKKFLLFSFFLIYSFKVYSVNMFASQ